MYSWNGSSLSYHITHFYINIQMQDAHTNKSLRLIGFPSLQTELVESSDKNTAEIQDHLYGCFRRRLQETADSSSSASWGSQENKPALWARINWVLHSFAFMFPVNIFLCVAQTERSVWRSRLCSRVATNREGGSGRYSPWDKGAD